jgi:hypothetical protein
MTTGNLSRCRQLCSTGASVFPLALGCISMSGMYGHADENESGVTIHVSRLYRQAQMIKVIEL